MLVVCRMLAVVHGLLSVVCCVSLDGRLRCSLFVVRWLCSAEWNVCCLLFVGLVFVVCVVCCVVADVCCLLCVVC